MLYLSIIIVWDIVEACGSCDAVRGSTSCPFIPKPTQTRLQIAVSDELKLVNIY